MSDGVWPGLVAPVGRRPWYGTDDDVPAGCTTTVATYGVRRWLTTLADLYLAPDVALGQGDDDDDDGDGRLGGRVDGGLGVGRDDLTTTGQGLTMYDDDDGGRRRARASVYDDDGRPDLTTTAVSALVWRASVSSGTGSRRAGTDEARSDDDGSGCPGRQGGLARRGLSGRAAGAWQRARLVWLYLFGLDVLAVVVGACCWPAGLVWSVCGR